MIAVVCVVLAAGVVALVISLASSGRSTHGGCIHVTAPGATGAVELDRCGSQARAVCGTVGIGSGPSGVFGEAVARECRKAGLPVG
jgi:hypothetical protein